jgi:hypothetical protein
MDDLHERDVQSLAHFSSAIRTMLEELRFYKKSQPDTFVSVTMAQTEAHRYKTEAQRFIDAWPDDSKGKDYLSDADDLITALANLNR